MLKAPEMIRILINRQRGITSIALDRGIREVIGNYDSFAIEWLSMRYASVRVFHTQGEETVIRVNFNTKGEIRDVYNGDDEIHLRSYWDNMNQVIRNYNRGIDTRLQKAQHHYRVINALLQ